MSNLPRAAAAAFALLCTVVLSTGAAAETSPPATPAAPGTISPSDDQASAFLKTLENFVTQSVQGLEQSVGAEVPKDVKTTPMPAAAAATIPEAKDHHIVKPDDDTILIVDPVTRMVVGVINEIEDDGGAGAGTPDAGSGSSK